MSAKLHLAVIFVFENEIIYWTARTMEELQVLLELAIERGFENKYRIVNLETRHSQDAFLQDGLDYLIIL